MWHWISGGLRILLITTAIAPSFVPAAQDSVEVARLSAFTWSYAVFVIFVTLIKIVALVVGYLVVKLGYSTMMAGVKGNDAV